MLILTGQKILQHDIQQDMRDPFNSPVDIENADHRSPIELTRPDVMSPHTDYMLGNGDSGPSISSSDYLVRSFQQKGH